MNRLLFALCAAKKEPIQSVLTNYGYDELHINEGVSLIKTLHESLKNQQAWFGREISLRTQEEKKERAARAAYEVTRKIAHMAFFKIPDAEAALSLHKESDSWKDDAQKFYRVLQDHPALTNRMKSFGYQKKRLHEEANRVTSVLSDKHEYPTLTIPTEQENNIEIFYGWMGKFIKFLSFD